MVEYGSLPFEEAETFFRNKVRIPTRQWDDLKKGQHARGFMIAGAQRDDMLCDFQTALRKGIEQGTTLEAFRQDFDQIVGRYGWSYNGGRGWRTRVIYDTNLRTSYMAGRYKQMTDPDVLAYRPFWRYRHGDSQRPRPQHLAWHGLVLAHDDGFWSSHYPPNGWGCKCSVEALSGRDVERLGKSGPDKAPPIVIDPKTGAPVGIDKGWDYNVGEAAWGKKLSETSMNEYRAQGAKAWERLTPGDWQSHGRKERIPADTPRAALGPKLTTTQAAAKALTGIMGAEERIYTLPSGGKMLVNAESLAAHVDLDRTPYLPLLPEVLEDPYETWLSFEQHKGTGKVVLRQRLIKLVQLDKKRGLLVTAQAKNGMLEAWTMVPTTKLDYINKQRNGKLLWGREEVGP
ncbi:PBECR2 nuclease fold domain-containing protein [Thiovibrio frasassiensis]|uniref:PBECR2 nuclease fold domain-containing protein n=1 Tax=Thiovibrio frasassiensis TaxID=2984131 RepID=A0A9X4MID4_9BACT|nr:PBECR2 nuclease fold domain-containing protein [Thiovibrio frasassiensis]MDG4475429.1 PBECR2 nuclease fold domain-containing protein [Thiovibrio frasassiensis]